jgi:hypothetical protein
MAQPVIAEIAGAVPDGQDEPATSAMLTSDSAQAKVRTRGPADAGSGPPGQPGAN